MTMQVVITLMHPFGDGETGASATIPDKSMVVFTNKIASDDPEVKRTNIVQDFVRLILDTYMLLI